MTAYEKIYDESIGNNGIITVRHAKEMGIPAIALVNSVKEANLHE